MSDTLNPQELPHADRRSWLALGVVCVGALMIVLDTTIVNVALPVIQDDLGFSQSSLTWIVNAYLISFGSFLLIAGRMGDLFGRKRIFLLGILVFTVSSVVCGIANGQQLLIAGRFAQGLGGALASASVLAIIVTDFPREEEQAKAMGVYMFVSIAGGSLGLLLGGGLVQLLNWHWIFVINVPIGIATYLAGRKLIDESEKHQQDGPLDYTGAAMVTVAVAIGVYAIVGAAEHGWTSLQTLGLGAIAVAGLAAFLWLEDHIKSPIMPLRILRVRSLQYSNVIRGLAVVGMYAAFFLGALYMERALKFSPIEIGLAFLPMSLVIGALSLGITAKVAARFGVTRTVVGAFPLAILGLLILASADANTAYFPTLLVAFVLLGTGMGLSFSPLILMSMRDVPEQDAGLASGMVSVSMQLAGAFGLAVLSSVAADRTAASARDGAGSIEALVNGFQLAYLIGAIAMAAAVALTLLAAREPKRNREPVPATETATERT
ncbi:MAG TPA: MFS transporter [Baekduia sp.]|nr:MFS transporter [Baekduia sp.]